MENITMKCTEKQMMNALVELYTWNYKKAMAWYEKHDEKEEVTVEEADAYEIGKHNGAIEALSAVMLQVFGGRAYGEIWGKTVEWTTGNSGFLETMREAKYTGDGDD